jgi:hypothetical protein
MSRYRQLAQCLPEPRNQHLILQPFRNPEVPIWDLVKRQVQTPEWHVSRAELFLSERTRNEYGGLIAASGCMALGEPSPELGSRDDQSGCHINSRCAGFQRMRRMERRTQTDMSARDWMKS